jgi:hypothetical protein
MAKPYLRTLILCAVSTVCFLTAAVGELPVTRPALFAGPWETTGPSGIDGIFLSFQTHAEGTADRPVIRGQHVSIRVYHRQEGHETGGWYSMPSSDASMFDGERLRIRTIDDGPVLDVTFDVENSRWTGTWRQHDRLREVVLERPRRVRGVEPNPFAGHWEGLLDATRLKAATHLHIDQSSDGVLTPWMDRVIVLLDQRHGELLRLVSVNDGTITLETTFAGGRRHQFQATLSEDGAMRVGTWDNDRGGTLNAATHFRRVR